MKQGRFSYRNGYVQCSDCGTPYRIRTSNPELAMIEEEFIEANHICPARVPTPKTRVLDTTILSVRARRVLGFVN